MSNLIDISPEAKKAYLSALKEKEEILKGLEPLRVIEEKAIKNVQKAEAELLEIRQKIVKGEGSRLAECSQIIAKLAPDQKKLNG